MFYWSRGCTHLVLTDDEEMDLVRVLADTDPRITSVFGESIPSDQRTRRAFAAAGYLTSPQAHRAAEKAIERHLTRMLREDPERLYATYVHRTFYGEQAQAMLDMMLDAYGRITKRATIGSHGGDPVADTLMDAVDSMAEDRVTVTLLPGPIGPFFRRRLRPIGRLSFARSSVHEIRGSVDNFCVFTSQMQVRFGRTFVRLAVYRARCILSADSDAIHESLPPDEI